jgi:arsenate reductase (glutaredoxin)
MSDEIIVYQKPTCTTCRQVYAALKDSGVDFETVNYYTDPIPKEKLLELLGKMKIGARDLLRTREPVYSELNLATRVLDDEEIVDLMIAHPDLIQRPIVERGGRAILARPAEKLREIL